MQETDLLLPCVDFHSQALAHVQLVEAKVLSGCKNSDEVEHKFLRVFAAQEDVAKHVRGLASASLEKVLQHLVKLLCLLSLNRLVVH